MIILDTNVVSALMRAEPLAVTWLDGQPSESVWITSVTLFEARAGVELLPPGRRRQVLGTELERVLAEDLENRVLDFDAAAAIEAAVLSARRQRIGKPRGVRDTMIAGIALSRRATLATRNVRDFSDLDVPVVSPWAVPPAVQQTRRRYAVARRAKSGHHPGERTRATPPRPGGDK